MNFDDFVFWPDGDCKMFYNPNADQVKKHMSGWAMRSRNALTYPVLKKFCHGVLICSRGCLEKSGVPICFRPANTSKVLKKQIGKF